jgi:hypothetical protein
MESLAYFVGALVMSMFALTAASLILSILAAIGKVPKVVGYVAVVIQAALTIFAYLIGAEFGLVYVVLLALCSVLVFTQGSRVRK